MQQFIVGVFQHERGPGRKPLVSAYTRDYHAAWQGCCLHRTVAENGQHAKKKAIAAHKAGLGCEPTGGQP